MGEFKIKEEEKRLGLLVSKEKVLVIDGSRLDAVRRVLIKESGLEKVPVDNNSLKSMDHLSAIFGLRPADKELAGKRYAELGEKFGLAFEDRGRLLNLNELNYSITDYEKINRFSEVYISPENLELISKDYKEARGGNPKFFSLYGYLIKRFLEQKFKHQDDYAKRIEAVIKVDKITVEKSDGDSRRVEITIITSSQELMDKIKKELEKEDKKLKSKPRKVLRRLNS